MEVMHGSELVVALKTERENTEYINGLRWSDGSKLNLFLQTTTGLLLLVREIKIERKMDPGKSQKEAKRAENKEET